MSKLFDGSGIHSKSRMELLAAQFITFKIVCAAIRPLSQNL